MKYLDFLKKDYKCPFCNLNKDNIIKSNASANLIIARAPYIKDHLLIVPKRHKLKLSNLSKKELSDLQDLSLFGLKKLHKLYEDISVVYREGNCVGKSVDHLHIHLIPKLKISAQKVKINRDFMSDQKYDAQTKKMKTVVK